MRKVAWRTPFRRSFCPGFVTTLTSYCKRVAISLHPSASQCLQELAFATAAERFTLPEAHVSVVTLFRSTRKQKAIRILLGKKYETGIPAIDLNYVACRLRKTGFRAAIFRAR